MKSEYCTHTIPQPSPESLRGGSFGLPPWIVNLVRALGAWIDRSRQRRRLAELNDAALKDIGLTRADVWIEIEKPFWRP